MSNLPAGFAEKYRRLLGPEADAFLASFDQPAEKGFRLNPLHGSDVPTPAATDQVPWNPLGYYGSVGGSDRAFWTGAVYSQEPSAMAGVCISISKSMALFIWSERLTIFRSSSPSRPFSAP